MEQASDATRAGAQLVADFQATMVNRATVEMSAVAAQESEDRAVRELQDLSRGNVLNPSFIPGDSGANLARSSMDAHIKKVQAEQIQQLNQSQLAAMSAEANAKHAGRNVTIDVLDINNSPIESIWYDARRGYYKGDVRTKQLKGKIKEVWLDRNALLLTPTLLSKTFNPGRKFFIVYIIDPATAQAMVKLTIG